MGLPGLGGLGGGAVRGKGLDVVLGNQERLKVLWQNHAVGRAGGRVRSPRGGGQRGGAALRTPRATPGAGAGLPEPRASLPWRRL